MASSLGKEALIGEKSKEREKKETTEIKKPGGSSTAKGEEKTGQWATVPRNSHGKKEPKNHGGGGRKSAFIENIGIREGRGRIRGEGKERKRGGGIR